MSLDRKDLRIYMPPDLHAAVLAMADADRMEPHELCEQVIQRYVVARAHAATVLAQHPAVAGLARIRPVSSGFDRIGPDCGGFERPAADGAAPARRKGAAR